MVSMIEGFGMVVTGSNVDSYVDMLQVLWKQGVVGKLEVDRYVGLVGNDLSAL